MSICISSCKIFINLHIQNLLFLFYIPIFTKHPHQFIYSTHLFNKIFIFPHSHLSHKTKTSYTATIKQRDRTHRSNNEIDDEALRWIKPINWTHWSTVKHCEAWQRDRTHWSNNEIDDEALWWIKPIDRTHWSTVKHCKAWQRDRTHWSNNEIDGEASSKTRRTAKHCYGSTMKLAVKARWTAKHCGGSMEEAGLRDWGTGEKEDRVEAEKERLRWGERNK